VLYNIYRIQLIIMFFCQKCDNLFDITKTIATPNPQTGGSTGTSSDSTSDTPSSVNSSAERNNYHSVIKKILANEEISDEDTANIEFNSITKDPSYTKLNSKQRDTVFNRLQEINPENNKGATKNAYFICKSCGFSEQIKPGTAIVRRMSESSSMSEDMTKYKDMVHAKELPHTKRYTCPNKTCKTHSNPDLKEAMFFRTDGYKVKYVCNECKTLWSLT
jgi:hypothetical protein